MYIVYREETMDLSNFFVRTTICLKMVERLWEQFHDFINFFFLLQDHINIVYFDNYIIEIFIIMKMIVKYFFINFKSTSK